MAKYIKYSSLKKTGSNRIVRHPRSRPLLGLQGFSRRWEIRAEEFWRAGLASGQSRLARLKIEACYFKLIYYCIFTCYDSLTHSGKVTNYFKNNFSLLIQVKMTERS